MITNIHHFNKDTSIKLGKNFKYCKIFQWMVNSLVKEKRIPKIPKDIINMISESLIYNDITEFKIKYGKNIKDIARPKNIHDFILKIDALFCMTGVDYHYNYNKIFVGNLYLDGKSLTEEENIKLKKELYDIKLEYDVCFICYGQIVPLKFETYGQVMNLLGPDYPDSVILNLEVIRNEKTYNWGEKNIDLNEDKIYIEITYNR